MEEKRRFCRICHEPITDWRNEGDIHPDCELKEDLEHIYKQTRYDGTGQDEEEMIGDLM